MTQVEAINTLLTFAEKKLTGQPVAVLEVQRVTVAYEAFRLNNFSTQQQQEDEPTSTD